MDEEIFAYVAILLQNYYCHILSAAVKKINNEYYNSNYYVTGNMLNILITIYLLHISECIIKANSLLGHSLVMCLHHNI